MTWQVLIVDDDPWVAGIYARTIEAVGRLEVAGVVTSGEAALDLVRHRPIDLMMLDLQLDGMDGLPLLRRLRSAGIPVDVIALTASRSATSVRAVIQHGALDYIVKPFAVERLRQSLGLFLNRAAALHEGELEQEAIDRVCAAGRVQRRWLPKGLTYKGVNAVRAVLAESPQVTSSEVSARTGLARVTARRYLEYLVATDQASIHTEPNGPGRPHKLYRAETIEVRVTPAHGQAWQPS
jgi:response regulator of citrate/malate metabolism